MTRKDHISGTDRINQSLENITNLPEVIVNVQGDEPFLNSQVILDLIKCFDKPNCEIATAYYDIGQEEAESPNMVKLVTNHEGRAHYFSRSKIPYPRIGNPSYKAHMGIYAYKTTILKSICNLAPSNLEQTESLEQLRWLENGLSIFCIKSETKSLGIDTKEDLIKAKELIKKGV